MAKLYYPDKTLNLMKKLDLNEATIHDVFHNGEYRVTDSGAEGVVRKYHTLRLEVGLYFIKSKYNNNEYVITFVWKRNRR